MSIHKVVESEGHGSFYGLIGFSLAVLLYPHYQWILPLVSSGLASQVDSAILMLGATGVITGLLYSVPVDRLVDRIIGFKAGHESLEGQLHYFPTRSRNRELLRFVTGVDYLSSTWRTPSWVSLDNSCKHALSSAIVDPSIQKEIWGLKNRSVIGLSFMLWGAAIRRLGMQLDLLYLAAIFGGFILLVTPWILRSSTRLPTTVRQIAALRYAQDTFSNWRALGSEINRDDMMKRLASDSKGVEIVISDAQWDRLNRTYTWMMNMLDGHCMMDYEVSERSCEIWARAIINITLGRNKGVQDNNLAVKYQNAFDVFRRRHRNGLPQWAEQLTLDDLSDLPKFLNIPESWNKVDPYYGSFRSNLIIAFEGLKDENTKALRRLLSVV